MFLYEKEPKPGPQNKLDPKKGPEPQHAYHENFNTSRKQVCFIASRKEQNNFRFN